MIIMAFSNDEIKRILLDQRASILVKPLGIERDALAILGRKMALPHVVVITGIRRSGKSTLLRQAIKKHFGDDDFYYVTFEDERFLGFQASEFNKIYESLLELFGKKNTFFLDEVQNVRGFEAFVRRFSENGFKFIITGSNANLLSTELGTKLAGRHVDILLKPFSFTEFLRLKGMNASKGTHLTTEETAQLKRQFDDYLVNGGTPEYSIYRDTETLMRIYEDVVIKDIAARYKIKNVPELKQLYQFLVTNFTCRFSYNSLKKATKTASVNTIKRYVSYLEEVHFAKVINKFDYSLKKQLVNEKKMYIVDNGFVKVLSKKISSDMGLLLENMVFNAFDGYDVYYYSGKRECDFVLAENREITKAVQVCWELNDQNREREFGGLLEAMEKFKLYEGLILTHDQEEKKTMGGKKITVMPVFKWLLESNGSITA